MSKQGLPGKARQGLALTLIALQVWQPVLAGVVATTPGVSQDQAANGVPIVNIAAPGAAGISHNTYTRFDVDKAGLILNNSAQPANTQLGGYIPGNANLGHGSARLILNEVSGKLPSQLNGYMEIAGQKAEMIIANPAGITCNGCGFINTSRSTLTTGKPLLGSDGSLSGFRVYDGELRFEGLGLNASNTERLALYSRALVLNAELHARELDVITGANAIDVATGTAPALTPTTPAPVFAIDSSSLGGMYANRIRLVGTEAGVGMRLAGPVAALTGNLEISSTGDVRLVRASAAQRVDVSTEGSVAIDSDGAGERDGISSGTGTRLQASGAVGLASGADITGTAVNITAGSILTENDSEIAARGALAIEAANQQLSGAIASRQTITLSGDTIANQGHIAANTGLSISTSSLDNDGLISSVGGSGRLDIAGELRNDNGQIQQGGALDITTGSVSNANGTIAANGTLTVSATDAPVNNTGGLLQGNEGTAITALGLVNLSGEVVSNGNINLVLGDGDLDNRGGLIETLGDIDLYATGLLQNSGGRFRSSGNLTLDVDLFDRASAGGTFAADGLWKIDAEGNIAFSGDAVATPGALRLSSRTGAIAIDSRIEAGGPTQLEASYIRIGQEGFIATQDTLLATADRLDNEGLIYGKTAVDLVVSDTFNNGAERYLTDATLYRDAVVLSEGNINLTALNDERMIAINNYGGHIESLSGDVTLKANALNNINIGWALENPYFTDQIAYSTSLAAWNAFNRGYAGEDVKVYRYSDRITNNDVESYGNRAQIVAGNDISIDANTIINDRSTISAGHDVFLNADAIENTATKLRNSIRRSVDSRYWYCKYDKYGHKKCNKEDQDHEGSWTYLGPEDSSKIISAIIEAGNKVHVKAGTIINGEDALEGSTSYIPGGRIPEAPGQAPWEAAPEGELNLGIVDPTSFSGFHLPNNGLFHTTPPGHPYLIETDPALNTYKGFLGSGYLLDHLNWAPDITQRRLGDSYYELLLIREALLASLGSRFVHPSIVDERAQYEYLMGNAIAASEALHLSPGIALSRAQIDALQADIVWMEERSIAGEKVLVPVVYLAQGSSRVLQDGAVIGGGTVSIETDSIRNAGLIRARDSLTISAADDISNLGGTMAAGGDLLLDSAGDILNESGQLRGENVLLQAEGDITHRTWSQREQFGDASNGNWNTLVGDTASVEAVGTQLQLAGGNIHVSAGQLSGNAVGLSAGGSILLDTVQVDQGYRFSGNDWEKTEAQVRQLQTQVLAVQDLQLQAGADIMAIAADLRAGTSARLAAGGDILLLAAEESDHYEAHSRHDGSFGRDKSHDLVHDESRLLGTTLVVGNPDEREPQTGSGQLAMNAAGNITLYASQVAASGQADVTAGGNINILAGINTISHSEQSSKEGVATFKNNQQGFISQEAAASAISAGADLNLNAGQDIRLTASVLHAGQTLRMGGAAVDEAALSLAAEGGAGDAHASGRPANVIVDTLALTNESWDETEKGFKGPLKELVKGLMFSAGGLVSVLELSNVDIPALELGSHTRTRTKDVLQVGSGLYAQDLEVNTQGTAAFVGANINVQGTAAITAKDIIIDAAAETHSATHKEGSDTVKGLGVKLNDDEVRVAGVQTTKTSVSDTQNITEWRGTSLSAGNLILNAEKNIDILGSQLNVVEDAILKAGGDLTIAGREGEVKQEHKETIETITVAAAVRNAYVDAVLAVKAIEEAKQALKQAKDAHDEAERKVDLGQLDASDLDFYKVNMAAAAANLAQATIAAAASIAIAAATTGTGGFYASGSANRDKTVTTSTSTQSLWQGSTLNVGGSALLAAGDTLTVQGSDVGVADTLTLDANKIALTAGQERATEKTKTTEEHEGVSISASSVGVNASQRDTDADSSSLHHVNTHLSAGTISSRSDELRVAGAQLYAGDIAIETNKLTVASLQDESQSKSRMRGMSAGIGTSSVSAGMEKSDSSASSLWVNEQTQIIGSNSLKIRAKDTTLTGAVIANAAYDENGQLIDQGKLDFQTDTLVVNDLHDVSKSKTTGFSISTSINTGGDKAEAGKPKSGQTTIGGQYFGHETRQITRATLGGGAIVVGGKTLNDSSATELDLATLNRDLGKAQEITVDKDIGGLNASVTIDHRLLTEDGLKDIAKDVKTSVKLGEDIYTAAKSIATNGNLGVTNIGNLIHNNTQATKLAEALLENPENSWIVEGLKDQNGENYPEALKAAAQIAQSLFGVKPTDVAFYDATQTTSSSLEDSEKRDVLGATVTDSGNSEYGNIFIDVSGQATKEGLATVIGHEVFETKVLQTGSSGLFFNDSDPTKEALADDFGLRLTARLNEATANGLTTSTNDWRFGMQQSQAVTAGTWRADGVGNASVEYSLPTYAENKRITQLAHGSEALANDLFAVTCAEIRCSAEFVTGSPEYQYYRRLEEKGEHPANSLAQKLIQQEQNRPGDLFEYGLMDRAEDAATLAKNKTIQFGEWEDNVLDSFSHTLTETVKVGVDFIDFIGAGIAQQAPEPVSQLGKNLQEQGPKIFLTIVPDTVKTIASAIEGDPQAVGGLLGGALVGGAPARLAKLGSAADTLVIVEPKFTPTSIANNDVPITPLYQGIYPEINFGSMAEGFGILDDALLMQIQMLKPSTSFPTFTKPDFYVGPNGPSETLPSTAYRYMRYLNDDGTLNKYAQSTIDSLKAPGSYFGFDNFASGVEARNAFQIRGPEHVKSIYDEPSWSDARLKGTFDTLQLYKDGKLNIEIPLEKGGIGPNEELFTRSYPQYGEGDHVQLKTDQIIKMDKVEILPEKRL